MAVSSNMLPSKKVELYYFSGRVRAFWKDKVFFLDQRNAAIVDISSLYLDGEKASQTDLQRMDAKVASCDWASAPTFHSYVVKYPSDEAPPWPYKLKGKKLWLAQYAWTGNIPTAVENEIKCQNVVHMPITYYTGKVISMFEDKVLYGDYRNNVMVHNSDLFIMGERSDQKDVIAHFNQNTPIIHSFICKLSFLTDKKYNGPEPHLPTWPMEDYGPNTWVAKFAWQGEMPEELRLQLSRFRIIKISEWDNCLFRFGVPRQLKEFSFTSSKSLNGSDDNALDGFQPLLATTKKEAAIVKGSLLLANNKYGLMNSYLDVIVFSNKNFYVNGTIFREGTPLCDFFQNRKVPLTAWIVPLPEPTLIFDVYVMWRAVCIWYGVPPEDMEAIKNRYDKGIIAGSVPKSLNTTINNRYTLVLGNITSLSHNNGFASAKVGSKTVNVAFKRRAVYLYGYRLHSKGSLVEHDQILGSGIWTMLVHPVVSASNEEKVQYVALALWQYQYQHYVASDLFRRILTETNCSNPETFHLTNEVGNNIQGDKVERHMSGRVIKTTTCYGIIESKSVTSEPSYVYFRRENFYVDGNILEDKQLAHNVNWSRQCNLYAHPVECKEIKDYPITMEATLVWMGKKPHVSSSSPEPLMSLPDDAKCVNGTHSKHRFFDSLDEQGNLSDCSPEGDSPDYLLPNDENFQKAAQVVKPTIPVAVHRAGRFVLLRKRFGVIKCGSKRSIENDFVLFDFSVLWIDGELLGANEGLYESIIHDDVQCNLIAYAIPNVDVGGFTINMQATSVWLGKKPCQVKMPWAKNSKLLEIANKLASFDIENASSAKDISGYVSKSKGANQPENKGENTSELSEIVVDPSNPYVGKHVGARMIRLGKETGIAKWRCAALEAEIFIEFSKKNMFVNLCPMKDDYELGQTRVCNFFVLPMKAKEIEGYPVSLYATCGWVGSKPHDIPIPGVQDHAQISLDGVHAVKMNGGKIMTTQILKIVNEKGIGRWRCVPLGGDVFIEFDKWDTSHCPTLHALFESDHDLEKDPLMCRFYVVPIKHKELFGYTVSASATYGWIGKKPSHFPKLKTTDDYQLLAEKLHVTPVDRAILERSRSKESGEIDSDILSETTSTDKSIKALDVVSTSVTKDVASKEKSDVKKKRKNKNEVWEDEENKTDLEGKIVELHSNVGRLQGTDGSQHYFSREHCYLYGVNLSSVELWHVLVQDETVSFKLNEISAGQTKVSRMWIGPEKIEDADKAAAFIYEWCNKHHVPEGARELLIQQLKVTSDENSAKDQA